MQNFILQLVPGSSKFVLPYSRLFGIDCGGNTIPDSSAGYTEEAISIGIGLKRVQCKGGGLTCEYQQACCSENIIFEA
jgi:hypothetical protein